MRKMLLFCYNIGRKLAGVRGAGGEGWRKSRGGGWVSLAFVTKVDSLTVDIFNQTYDV